MKSLLLAFFVGVLVCTNISAQTTAFSFQGSLQSSGNQANGNYDFEFKLFDLVSGGTQQGSTIQRLNVAVTNGIFGVTLDFGALVLPGANRFLEIGVRNAGSSGGFQQLLPRQSIASVPYSIRSLNSASSDTATTATNALQLGGVAANQYVVTTDPRMSDPRDPTAGSGNYIQNTTATQLNSNFHISDTGIAGVFDSALGYRIGGYSVLSAPGTGLSNIFAGYRAGNLALTGTHNSALGYITGENLTTGYDNSLFGKSSGSAMTTGFRNTFAGSNSGAATTTGDSNSFFGGDAGKTNVTGSFNAFFGYQAGLNNGGTENSFFGAYAGEFHGNGFGNTFLGRYSGVNSSSGNYNIAIGYNSGFTADGFSFSTAIGTDALATASNQITLGRGNGADTVRIPGALNVTGTISGNGSGLTGLDMSQFTTGILAVARGGTGLGSAGSQGNFLRSDGSNWTSSPIAVSDVPAGSPNYIQNSIFAQPLSNFHVTGLGIVDGTLSGNILNAYSEIDLNNSRVLSGSTSSISVGIGAGSGSTIQNSFFGVNAGKMTDNGFSAGNNSFFGHNAGKANTSGNSNSHFGSFAGQNATADANTFLGYASGSATTTGNKNVFLGADTGLANTTGSFNTLVGFSASAFGSGLSSATAIGALAQVAQSNSIVLGAINGVNGATASTNVGIGTTAPAERLHVVGDGLFTGNIFGAAVYVSGLGSDGDLFVCRNSSSQRLSYCSSSLRYKTNISNFTSGLDLLNRFRPIAFDWKSSGAHDIGFGAEDVADIDPRFVTYNDKGEVEGVKYDRLSVAFVNAFKEQQAQIEKQQTLLEKQQALIEQLEKRIKQLEKKKDR